MSRKEIRRAEYLRLLREQEQLRAKLDYNEAELARLEDEQHVDSLRVQHLLIPFEAEFEREMLRTTSQDLVAFNK
jgi:hypothetical protein